MIDILYTAQVWINYISTFGDGLLTIGLIASAGLAFFGTIQFLVGR